MGLVAAALGAALLAAAPTEGPQQEVRYTRAGHAACLSLEVWEQQAVLREAEHLRQWYGVVRERVAAGDCWLTRDSTPVEVHPTRHPRADQVRRATVKADTLWWLGREAIR